MVIKTVKMKIPILISRSGFTSWGVELAKKTKCSISGLRQIVKKGQGAYYSSGSRPNQTSQSWGLARLASALTSGKAAAIDYDIINKGCNHNKTAFILANKSRNKYGYGNSKTKKVIIWGSSYSSALALKIAGDGRVKVDAVLSFAPGESEV